MSMIGSFRIAPALCHGFIFFSVSLFAWGCGSKKAVDSGNRPPVLSRLTATPNTISVSGGEISALKATASDPDGDHLTYLWIPQLGYIIGGGPEVGFSGETCCTGTIDRKSVV